MTAYKPSAQRSALMARIRRSNTKPELLVRRLLHRLGYRFRVQFRDVPGRPDVAFPNRKKAIFIHGCFWHAHEGCKHNRIPKTRAEFWASKFKRNRERDARLLKEAHKQGWKCMVLWECEIQNVSRTRARLVRFLGKTRLADSITAHS